jgi:MFS family permease
MGAVSAIRSWFHGVVPREPAAGRFVLLSLVQSAGHGVFLTSSPFFFITAVGLSPEQVGIGLTVAGLSGLLTCVPMGMAGDRFGSRRMLLVVYTALAVLFGLYSLVSGFAWFVSLTCTIAVFESACGPLAAALVYEHYGRGEKALEVRSQVRTAINVGFPMGAAAAGVAIGIGGRSVFVVVVLVTAAANLVCSLLATGLRGSMARATQTTRGGAAAVSPAAMRDLRFVAVAVVNGLLQMNEVILTLAIPLWIVVATTAPASVNAVVLVVNSVLVVALQVLFSRKVNTATAAGRALRQSGLLFALACVIYSTTQGLPSWLVVVVLLVGVVVQTIGEVYQASASFAIAFELAEPSRLAEYQGVMALGIALRQFVGPALIIALVISLGQPGWWLLGALFVLFALIAKRLVRAAERHRVARGVAESSTPIPDARSSD